MVVVVCQQWVVVEVVLGGHGQLGLEQHWIERRTTTGAGVGQQLTKILLVQARVEQVGVGVTGRRLGWSH